MSQTRKFPNTDIGRQIALNAAKTKKDNVAPGDIVLSTNSQDRLDITQPLFESKMNVRGIVLQAQSEATTLKVSAQVRAKMFISHFIQVFNLCVERGVFPASHRAFYQLDVNSNSVPNLDSEDLILIWGKNLIDGDAARVAAGGAAMGFPTIAQVTTAFNAFKNAGIAQSNAKDAYDLAQEAVSGMRTDVDNLIVRMWNEIEAAFSEEEIESKRRHSREWGVVYVSTKTATISGNVTKKSDGSPLEFVNVTLLETDNIVQTDAHGHYELKTNFAGDGNLEFTLDGYETQTFAITLDEGGTLTQDAALVAV